MEDLTGRQFGPYRIVAPLGEGGMASVYRAYQASVDRYVALKVLPRYFARDPEFVGRFSQEAKMLAKLQHPRILAVHDFGESDGYTYMVMPFVDSGTLADLMEGKPLPLQEVGEIVTQVADALDYAHSLGVVHRDVKPSNVLVDRQGNCLLTDFGIAKMVEGTSTFTRTGATIGTPAYMSPEQIQGIELDGRSDVYSLGIMLYQMLTGRPPFQAETPPAVFVKHLHDPLPPPNQFNKSLPDSVERVVLKALTKDPKDRFQSAGELADALRRALAGETVDVVLPSRPQARMPATEAVSIPGVTKAPSGRSPLVYVFGAIAVIAAVIAVVLLVVKPGAEETAAAVTPPPTQEVIPTEPPPTKVPTQPPAATATATPIPPTATPQPAPTSTPVPEVAPAPGEPDPWGEVVIPAGEPIRLAFAGMLTGDLADMGQAQYRAFQKTLEETEPVYGFPFDIDAMLVVDDACSAELAEDVALELIAVEDVVGVVGHGCSQACEVAAPIYEKAHLVNISPSCTKESLNEDDWLLFNRMAPADSDESEAFLERILDSLAHQAFKDSYQERFGEPTASDPYPALTFDATRLLLAAIRRVAAVNDEGALVIGRQALARQVRNMGELEGITGNLHLSNNGERLLPGEGTGCGPDDLQVVMVSDVSGVGYSPFNAGAWEALQWAQNEQLKPICTRLVEPVDPNQYLPVIVEAAKEGADLVITVGFFMAEPTMATAESFPETTFVVIDHELDVVLPNVMWVVYDVDEASFLAGYLAAGWAMQEDPGGPEVAYLAGVEIPTVQRFAEGFTTGAHHYNQVKGTQVKVTGDYAGSFEDPNLGYVMAQDMLGTADVIFPVAGFTGDGVLQAALERGRTAIGVDVDKYYWNPEFGPILLTSVEKRFRAPIMTAIDMLLEQRFAGGTYVGTLANGGVGISPFHDYAGSLPEGLVDELRDIKAAIIDGEIDTGW